MSDEGRSAASRPDQVARIAPRYKVFEPIEISDGADSMRAHLINVSVTGALVHTDARPDKGKKVDLKIGADWFGGRVMWVVPPRLGLAFNGPLPDAVIARLLGG